MGLDLSSSHRSMLEDGSGLSSAIIEQRGYYTATEADQLADIGFSPDQCRVPSLVVPQWGVDGSVVGYQIRPDDPRTTSKGHKRKYEFAAGALMRIDVPPCILQHLNDPARPLWITEGSKKADAAAMRGLTCISLAGVWNWRGSNTKAGSVELADWDAIAIKGRVIYIAFDNDVMSKREVRLALQRLAGMLKRRGAARVLPVLIPSIGESKAGLDDFFVAGGTSERLRNSVDESILKSDEIITSGRPLHDIAEDAMRLIVESNFPPYLFVRAREIVRVVKTSMGAHVIETLSPAAMRGIADRCASWVKVGAKDLLSPVFPPKDVIDDLLSADEWPGVPPVVAITHAPVLAPNGVLTSTPGYDPESQYYIAASQTWPEWQGTVEQAVSYLFDEVLADFPFDSEASRANTLALMLLPIVRPAIDGPTPLHFVEAPTQGSGKSLLVRVCLLPTASGDISPTPGTREEEEWRKKIATCLLEGRSYVFLDNLSRKIDSDALAGALTSTEWADRGLSTMKNIRIPVRCVWAATGNNAELSRDILRRTVPIRIDPKCERPEDRTGFKHANLERYVKDNRAKITSALIALVKNYVESDKAYSGAHLGSFESWCKVVGGILEKAGVQGFLQNLKEFRATASDDDGAWADFYQRWATFVGVTSKKASDVYQVFVEDATLAGMLGTGGESNQKTRLGHILRRRVGVVAGDFRIVADTGRAGSRSYRIERVVPFEPSADGGVLEEDGGVLVGFETKPHHEDFDGLNLNDDENRGLVGFGGVLDTPSAHARNCARTHAYGAPAKPHQTPNPTKPVDEAEIVEEFEL